MSLIEKAVERLDQLKRAGVDVAAPATDAPVTPAARASTPAPAATPQTRTAAAKSATKPAAPAIVLPEGGKRVTIDLERLQTRGFVTPNNSRSLISEEYRVIKRPLLKNIDAAASGRHANLIMVSSAVPGEGKSFSAINLAISLAMEVDHTVLLVDADVSRPSVLNHLGLPPAAGLMDVLLKPEIDLADVMLRTNIEKLSILPAGVPHPRATEFLASDGMVNLLDEIATRYPERIVVFDSPPLLLTTEARVLAMHMGQVVVVVEAARTSHSMVKQALSTIESCPIRLMLLNKTRDAGPGSYGYYTPYGYGNAQD